MNKRELKRTIIALYILRICMGGMACCIPIIVLFWKSYGLSLTKIMILQSLFACLLMILEVPSGYMADLWGRRNALILSGISFFIGSGIYLFADCYFHFVLTEIFCAFAISLISGADSALLYDMLKNANQQERYEKIWGTILATSLISYGIFNALGGVLYTYNIRLPFYIGTVIILGMIPAALSLREPAREKLESNRKYVATLFNIVLPALGENFEYRRLLIIYALVYTGLQAGLWFYQPYFQSCGIAPFWFGFIFTGFNIVAALGSKYANTLNRLAGWLPFGIIPLFLIAASYMIMGIYTGTFGFSIIFIQQLVRGWIYVAISMKVNSIIESKERATLISFCTMCGSCTYAVILPVLGFLADSLTVGATLIICGTACLSIAILGLIRRRTCGCRALHLES